MVISPEGSLQVPLAIAAASGYLLGAIPFGYLVARAHGVNIFEVGSKSPGATNVKRVLGSGPGNTVYVLDALKGSAAAFLPVALQHESLSSHPGEILGFTGLAAALVGHSFSCFTRFRGGKGVATASGGLLVLVPLVAAVAGALWVLTFFSSRYVSLASILAAASLPVTSALLGRDGVVLWVTAALAIFVVLRHRTNIVRLFKGTENRFERKGRSAKDASKS